ncbi:MAG: D-alanyl-D-alanine carboxypeptidase family protein [Bacilli bacterium]|nr:D-alanyl-D-alanine carboxypeptidase family protein [Bacilli bacterium]
MKKIMLFILLLFPIFVKAEDLTPNAESGILIEYSTGKILYSKKIDEKLAPASMTKIMTLLLIMEAVEEGKINLDDNISISTNASSMGGSQVFLDPNTEMKAEELIKSIAIASANDSAVAMAEAISGTTANFVSRMNSRAKELGCKNTNFKNVHGLDEEGHYSTTYDMSLIARELLKHEQILKYTSTYEAYLNKPNGTSTWMVNTNKLIKYYTGLDGLKTGFTKTAGYCLTSTAKRNDMRLISVVMKEPSSQVRNSETISLLNYGFSNYKIKTILKKDQKLGTIEVQNGKKELADITILEDATNLESINDNKEYSFNIVTDKVKAPLKKGDKVGTLELTEQGTVIKRLNITVKENIPKANIWDLYKRNFKSIIIGSIH